MMGNTGRETAGDRGRFCVSSPEETQNRPLPAVSQGVDFYPRYPYNKPRYRSVLRKDSYVFKNIRNKDYNHRIAFQKGIDHETYRDSEYP